jgi:hypothetical protein
MKRISLVATALSALIGIAAAMPAEAMPAPTTPTVNRTTDVQQARVVVRYGYYRGHRGYRYRRPGYRFYGGFWYPPVAFGPTIVVRPGRAWYWCGRPGYRHRCYR